MEAMNNRNLPNSALNSYHWFFVILIFIISSALYAQNSDKSGTIVARTREGFMVSQHISFPEVPGVLRYIVDIEKHDDASWTPGSSWLDSGWVLIEQIETRNNSVELSLSPGFYRYRYSAYNMMNLREGQSKWQIFEVRPAIEPMVHSYEPFYGLLYELADPSGTLIVTGDYFYYDSEFALVRDYKADWSGVSLDDKSHVISPNEILVSGKQAALTFDRTRLRRGIYTIFIRNPGGLWSVFGRVRVGYKNNSDLIFSMGYSPLLAAFDYANAVAVTNSEDTDEYGNPISVTETHQQLDFFNPRGYYLGLSWTFVKTKKGNFGLDFTFHFLVDKYLKSTWDKEISEGFRFFEPFNAFHSNFYYQRPVNERWMHFFQFGLGANAIYDNKKEEAYRDNAFYIPVSFNISYYSQYFIWKNLFVQAGLEIQFVIYVNSLIFRPGIGMGWQMGRWAEHAEVAEAISRGENLSVPVTGIPKNEHLFSLGWLPMVPLNVDLYSYNTDGNRDVQILQPFNAGGYNLQYAYIPIRWGANKLGFEMELSMLLHKGRSELNSGTAVLDSFSEIFVALIRYQRVLAQAWQLNVRTGIGLGNAYIYTRDAEQSINIGGPRFIYKAGVSAQYFYWRNAYAEAGLNFVFIQTDTIRSIMKPQISLGWQLSNNAESGLRLERSGLPRFDRAGN